MGVEGMSPSQHQHPTPPNTMPTTAYTVTIHDLDRTTLTIDAETPEAALAAALTSSDDWNLGNDAWASVGDEGQDGYVRMKRGSAIHFGWFAAYAARRHQELRNAVLPPYIMSRVLPYLDRGWLAPDSGDIAILQCISDYPCTFTEAQRQAWRDEIRRLAAERAMAAR